MSNDLFDNANASSALDPEKDYSVDLVGEGKKFKDVAGLARGKLESDGFITRLQQENEGLRQELQTRLRLEEIANSLSQARQPDPVVSEVPPASTPVVPAKEVDLTAAIRAEFAEMEKQKKRDENFKMVQTTMASAFGPNYVEVLKQKAVEMGTTPQRFNELAITDPALLLKLVGAENTSFRGNDLFTPPPASHASGFKPSATERNKAYYDKIKKENPSLYWSKETQNSMHNDAQKQGERFFI